jgi:membrane protein YqaA with SNARE-associated domain
MIAPMTIAKKNKFIKFFLIATIFSVLGGMLGYVLGAYFLDFAMNIVEFYNYMAVKPNIQIKFISIMSAKDNHPTTAKMTKLALLIEDSHSDSDSDSEIDSE